MKENEFPALKISNIDWDKVHIYTLIQSDKECGLAIIDTPI